MQRLVGLRWFGGLAVPLIIFGALLVFINPLRNYSFNDDFAYASDVRGLLTTGQYHISSWTPAWIPAHIYWGTLFSRILGYSFSSLHISTVVLMAIGIIGFYFLCREYDIPPWLAGILCIILLGSPLLLQYTYTFMTDVPFVVYLILSFLFYTRGVRTHSIFFMILGGLASTMAITTRLFGAAEILGLAVLWALDANRRRSWRLFGAGAVLPTLTVLYVIYFQSSTQEAGPAIVRLMQNNYMQNPVVVATSAIWRLMVTLQYMALFCAPILVIAFAEFREALVRASRISSADMRSRRELYILLGMTLFILGMSLYGSFVLGNPGVMPILKWNLFGLSTLPQWLPGLLTLATIVGAFLLGRILILRYLDALHARDQIHGYVVDILTISVLGAYLILYDIGDRYLLPVVPLALIAAGRHLSTAAPRFQAWLIAACAVFVVASALWVRQSVTRVEAQWQAAEDLVAQGVSPRKISTMFEWNMYYGEYELYLQDLDRRNVPLTNYMHYFTEWQPELMRNADYIILPSSTPPDMPGYETVRRLTYRDMLLQVKYVYVSHRLPAQ